MRLLLSVLTAIPFSATACAFKNETYPVAVLAVALFLIVSSLWLFFKCFPNNKFRIKILVLISQIILIIFVFWNWDVLYPCSSNFDLYSGLAFTVSVVLFISAIICASWRFIESKRDRK